MDFNLPGELLAYLRRLDDFIETQIKPLQARDDNERFFDHRREWARTDFDQGGLPRPEWQSLLDQAKQLADEAGFYRFSLPEAYGGQGGGKLWMAVIREHLAAKGLGLFNDLQSEHSVVGNFPAIAVLRDFGSPAQQQQFIHGTLARQIRISFGLTEPEHGSDASQMATRAVREQRHGLPGWRLDGEKMWTTGMHTASHCCLFARTSGEDGSAQGISAFLVPVDTAGVKIEEYLWTFNMPTDHPRVSLSAVWVPDEALFGELDQGQALAQAFVLEHRIRQAASSLGAAAFCVAESVRHAREHKPAGAATAGHQAIQLPLIELATQIDMLRLLIRKTAWEMDQAPGADVQNGVSNKVSMCNYWANRLVCDAADRAMQVHGGHGYSRHKPFEHIYRHHRRYRITEGSEALQMRHLADGLFGHVQTTDQST